MNWIYFSIFTAFLWGMSYTAAEQVIGKIDKNTYIFITCSIITVIYGIACKSVLSKDLIVLQQDNHALKWLVIAIIASSVGNYMSMLAIQTSNASLAAALEITYPFWCMFFAWIFFGQSLTRTSMLGVAIVFVGVIITIVGRPIK